MSDEVITRVMRDNELPTYREAADKRDEGVEELTELEEFIIEQEPASPAAEKIFRDGLLAVVQEWYNIGHLR